MLNLKIAELVGIIKLDDSQFQSGMRRIDGQLRRFVQGPPIAVRLSLDTRQVGAQLNAFTRKLQRWSRTPFTAQINLQPFNQLNSVLQQMTASANAYRAAMANMPIPRQPPAGGGMGPGYGYGRGGMGFGRAGSFVQGGLMAAGMPFALNPHMAAGALTVGAGLAAGRSALEAEGGMASLQAIAGLTPRQRRQLYGQLGDVAVQLPGVNFSKALGLAESGARAGVGANDLGAFTRSLGKLGAAIPDVDTKKLADDVLRTMAAYNMGTQAIDGFSSALLRLDQQAVASAPEILNVTRRLAGAGQAAGLSLPQIMSLASVMRDVGLPVESGSTAFSRIMTKLAKPNERAELAEALGMNEGALATQFNANPLDALGSVLEGIRRQPAGSQKLSYLSGELGFSNQRDIMFMGQIAPRFGEVAGRAQTAASEMQTQSQLQTTLSIKTSSTNHELERFADNVGAIGRNVGGALTAIGGTLAYYANASIQAGRNDINRIKQFVTPQPNTAYQPQAPAAPPAHQMTLEEYMARAFGPRPFGGAPIRPGEGFAGAGPFGVGGAALTGLMGAHQGARIAANMQGPPGPEGSPFGTVTDILLRSPELLKLYQDDPEAAVGAARGQLLPILLRNTLGYGAAIDQQRGGPLAALMGGASTVSRQFRGMLPGGFEQPEAGPQYAAGITDLEGARSQMQLDILNQGRDNPAEDQRAAAADLKAAAAALTAAAKEIGDNSPLGRAGGALARLAGAFNG